MLRVTTAIPKPVKAYGTGFKNQLLAQFNHTAKFNFAPRYCGTTGLQDYWVIPHFLLPRRVESCGGNILRTVDLTLAKPNKTSAQTYE